MLKQFIIGFVVAALSVASAETFRVTFAEPSVVKGTELKAGDYRVEVKDNLAVIAKGKQRVEVPVRVENADKKFSSTKVLYGTEGGKYLIQEIRIGGSTTRLVFESSAPVAGAQ